MIYALKHACIEVAYCVFLEAKQNRTKQDKDQNARAKTAHRINRFCGSGLYHPISEHTCTVGDCTLMASVTIALYRYLEGLVNPRSLNYILHYISQGLETRTITVPLSPCHRKTVRRSLALSSLGVVRLGNRELRGPSRTKSACPAPQSPPVGGLLMQINTST